MHHTISIKDVLFGKSNFTVDVEGIVKTEAYKDNIVAKVNESKQYKGRSQFML